MAWVNLNGEAYQDVSQLKMNNVSFKNYMNNMRSYNFKALSDDEIRKLIRIYQTTEDEEEKSNALSEIMLHNQGLVISLAMKFGNSNNCADMIGEANIALQHAVEMFDLNDKRCKFYSYALICMFREMLKANDMYTNQVSHHRNSHDIKIVNKWINDFYQENMRDPSEVEIRDFIEDNDDINTTYENIRPSLCISLDMVGGLDEDDNYSSLYNDTSTMIYNDDAYNLEKKEYNEEQLRIIDAILNEWANNANTQKQKNLCKRNIEIFYKFYGVNGYVQKTYNDLANEYHVDSMTISTSIRKCIYVLKKKLVLPNLKNNNEKESAIL